MARRAIEGGPPELKVCSFMLTVRPGAVSLGRLLRLARARKNWAGQRHHLQRGQGGPDHRRLGRLGHAVLSPAAVRGQHRRHQLCVHLLRLVLKLCATCLCPRPSCHELVRRESPLWGLVFQPSRWRLSVFARSQMLDQSHHASLRNLPQNDVQCRDHAFCRA
jgi:hypothetical protein